MASRSAVAPSHRRSVAAVVGVVAAVLLAVVRLRHLSAATEPAYFAELAWSFLHGHVDLVTRTAGYDLSPFGGRIYAYWPPLAAFLMMPIVALRGPLGFPQRYFAIAVAIANAALFYALAVQVWTRMKHRASAPVAAGAALVFALGTSNVVFALAAWHWYVGQLTASAFFVLALAFAFAGGPGRRRYSVASSVALALAIFGRQHLISSFPLFALLAIGADEDGDWRLAARRLLAQWHDWLPLTIAPAAAVALLLAYNHARFGSWLENGMTYQAQAPRFMRDVVRYGVFSVHYLPHNVYATLLRLPGCWRFDGYDSAEGFSLFAQCPFLALVFVGRVARRFRPLAATLWSVALLIATPILMLEGTGWVQFGARYLHDFVPLLMVVVLLKLESRRYWMFAVLGAAAIAINLYGALLFAR